MSKKEKHSVYIKTITKTLLDIKTQLLGNKSSGKADNDLVKAINKNIDSVTPLLKEIDSSLTLYRKMLKDRKK
jgi:hypothetical protein